MFQKMWKIGNRLHVGDVADSGKTLTFDLSKSKTKEL